MWPPVQLKTVPVILPLGCIFSPKTKRKTNSVIDS